MLKQDFGIENLQIFKLLDWHLGNFYFQASSAQQRIFIKTDFSMGLLANEVQANWLMQQHPILHKYNTKIVCSQQTWVAYEFVSPINLHDLLSHETDMIALENVSIQLCEILDALYALGIVHRDFRLHNLLVDDHHQLKLIDFYFAISSQLEHGFIEIPDSFPCSELILKKLGHTRSPLEWDDAYGISKSIQLINHHHQFDDMLDSIAPRIGRLVYRHHD